MMLLMLLTMGLIGINVWATIMFVDMICITFPVVMFLAMLLVLELFVVIFRKEA